MVHQVSPSVSSFECLDFGVISRVLLDFCRS